ncbi:MAG: hypothetical protein JNK58_02030 [Phycisphaerae bacterium]|nr:hypothetical protein [Phycisphaerae bacterium]
MSLILTRRAPIALLMMSFGTPAWAADNMKLEAMEKTKVSNAIGLLEQAWKDCLSMKIVDVMGSGGDNMPYEKIKKEGMDVDPTFQDAINHIKNMLDKDNIVSKDMNGWGSVDVQPGVDNDKIILRKKLLQEMCDPAASAADKMIGKLQLVATLANETMHVFQKWTEQTGNAGLPKLCDGEKDSDMSSIKALEPIVNALTDAMGMPHTTIAGVRTDPQYVFLLGLCMEDAGATSAADIAKVQKAAKEKLGETSPRSGYKGRKDRFAFDLTPPFTNWATWYYGGSDAFQETLSEADIDTRGGSRITGDDLSTTRYLSLPPGQLIVQTRGYINELGQEMVINLATNTLGQVSIFGYRDTNDDGLPESLPQFNWTLPIPPTGSPRPIYQLRIYPVYPDTYRDRSAGLTIFDPGTGSVLTLPLQPDGSSLLPPQFIFVHPALVNPDLHLLEMITPSDSSPAVRVIFGDPSEGSANIMWFDHFPDNSTIAFMNPGQFFAQAAAPTNTPGIDQLFISPTGGPIRLMANPGAIVELVSIGRGARQTVGLASIGQNGVSPFFNTFAPIQGNDLYQFFKPGNIPFEGFLSRVGTNIACAVHDETGDGTPDRLQLSTDPPRLHLLTGDGLQPGVFQYQHEIALELNDYVGFRGWSDEEGRNLLVPEVLDGFTRISAAPLRPQYAQRLLDLDGDGAEDDAAVIVCSGFSGERGSFFDIFYWTHAPGPALNTDLGHLPPNFEPGAIAYPDLNNDHLPDLVITDYNTGDEMCFRNISTPGNVRFEPCSVTPPCCPGNADKITPGSVNFADVTTVLANFNMPANPDGSSPGDADCNSAINFSDITSVLANFLNSCP